MKLIAVFILLSYLTALGSQLVSAQDVNDAQILELQSTIHQLQQKLKELEIRTTGLAGDLAGPKSWYDEVKPFWDIRLWIISLIAGATVLFGLYKRFLESEPIESLRNDFAHKFADLSHQNAEIETRNKEIIKEQDARTQALIKTIQRNIKGSTGLFTRINKILEIGPTGPSLHIWAFRDHILRNLCFVKSAMPF